MMTPPNASPTLPPATDNYTPLDEEEAPPPYNDDQSIVLHQQRTYRRIPPRDCCFISLIVTAVTTTGVILLENTHHNTSIQNVIVKAVFVGGFSTFESLFCYATNCSPTHETSSLEEV